MVEFALTFLLFLTLVLGLMELGRAVWTYTTLAHATRAGVRFAMVHGSSNAVLDGNGNDVTDDTVESVVKSNAIGLDPDQIVVGAPTWDPDRQRGSFVQLTVTYPFQFVTGGLVVADSTINLSSSARMVVTN